MAIRILSSENITGDITTSGKVNAGDRILTEATTSNALLQVKYNSSNYLEGYYDKLNVVGGDFLIQRSGDTKIQLTAVGTTFTNLSNTSAASSSVDEVKIGTFGAGRPAIFLGSSNTTYTNSTWFIENIGASGKFRIGRNGLDILEIENGGASTFKGPSVTVLNASDPSVAVSDTDTNYKGIMTWRNSGSENVLEFVTRYAGTYYTNNLVLDRGNVAIGTETPDQTGYGYKVLTVMGGTTAGYAGTIELLAPSVDAEGQNYGILSFGAGGTRTAMISANRQAANNAGNLRFWTAPGGAGIQERMRIDKDGNVIIGNTNVDNPNSLDKVLEIEHGGSVGLILNDSRDTPIGLENRGAVFHLTHNTNSRLVVLGASGNVGIGTTSPSSKLQVGDGTTNVNVKVFGSATSGIQIHTASGNIASLEQYFGDEGSLWLRKGATTKVLVRADGDSYFNGGNVGIGTNSPSRELDIQASSGWAEIALRGNTGGGGSLEFWTNTTKRAEIFADTEDIVFRNTPTNQERMRITSGGYVAIPDTSGNHSGAASLIVTKKSSIPYQIWNYSGTSTSFRLEMDEYVTAGNVRQYFQQTNGGVSNGFSMTFNTGSVIFGDLEVASATQNSGSAFKKDSKARMTLCQGSNSTALTDLQEYFNPNGAVGKIQTSGSATLFTTSSDYRLKEDLKSFSGLEVISKIPVYDFKWKISNERGYGVMAHELQEVLPQAVGGDKDYEKDHVVKEAKYDDDHNLIKEAEYGKRPSYQTVDYSKIVPLLVKSIQELKAEVDKLKQECKCKN